MQTDVASGNIDGVGTTLKPFQFRGRFLTALALRLSTAPDARFYELLAIAGLYRTSDSLGADVRHKMVQIYLEDERLIVAPFG